MRVEIDLPELPEGCDRVYWCHPNNGDWYLHSLEQTSGELIHKWVRFAGRQANYLALVAMPIWTPPAAWSQLFFGWLTKDDDGRAWVHELEPRYCQEEDEWFSEGHVFSLSLICPEMQIPVDIPANKCCFYLGDQ